MGVQCRTVRDEVEVRRWTYLWRRVVPRQGSRLVRSRFVRSVSPPPLAGSDFDRRASKVHLISPLPLLSDALAARTMQFALAGFTSASTDDAAVAKKHEQPMEVKWTKPKGGTEREEGRLVEIDVPGTLKQVTWHKRGDYFSTVASEGKLRCVDLKGM